MIRGCAYIYDEKNTSLKFQYAEARGRTIKPHELNSSENVSIYEHTLNICSGWSNSPCYCNVYNTYQSAGVHTYAARGQNTDPLRADGITDGKIFRNRMYRIVDIDA